LIGTHKLESIKEGKSQENERKGIHKVYSHPGECRATEKLKYQEKVRNEGALTSLILQREVESEKVEEIDK
jgi:hypothetical protein